MFKLRVLTSTVSILATLLFATNAGATSSTKSPLKRSAQFNATAGSAVVAPYGNTQYTERVGTAGLGEVQISYDATSGTYTLRQIADGFSVTTARTFTPSGIYNVYMKDTSVAFDQIKLYNGRSSGPTAVPLSYVNFGLWTHQDKVAQTTTQTAIAYGTPTPEAGMPRTGSARYRTMVHGSSTIIGTSAGTRDVGGNASFTADFANSTVSTVLNLSYQQGSTETPIGGFSGTGSIYSDQFGGPLTSNVRDFVAGSFAGAFYGPKANEMGYSFSIYRYNPDPYAGAAVDFHDEAIVGTVVGAKY